MWVVGLTGGIASGKSTVGELFAQRGIDVIDADRVAREVVMPGEPALDRIAERFGAGILAPDGSLDRKALREIVFGDSSRREELERILHPLIRQRMWELAAASAGNYCILAVPLLVEGGLHQAVDRVLVVDVSPETQRQRLRQRDRISAEQVDAILAAQATRETRLAAADDVIDNNGELEALVPQVASLHHRYLVMAEQNAGKIGSPS